MLFKRDAAYAASLFLITLNPFLKTLMTPSIVQKHESHALLASDILRKLHAQKPLHISINV